MLHSAGQSGPSRNTETRLEKIPPVHAFVSTFAIVHSALLTIADFHATATERAATRPGSHYWVEIAERPSRNTYFWILPVAVLGSSATNVKSRGVLKCASLLRTNSRSSCGATETPDLNTTKAWGTSPHFASGTPTTAASTIAGCPSNTPSTSTDEIFSPPLMMTSLNRSLIST